MCNIFKKSKVLIAVALIVIVAGLAIFGFLGFNQTVDHKMSYEVKVEIDQNVTAEDDTTASALLEKTVNDYLADKDISDAKFAFQKMDEGSVLIYKFNKDVELDESELVDYVQPKLDEKFTAGVVEVSAEYSEVVANDGENLGWVLLSIGIAIAVAFIYAVIMEKLAGAVAVICSSVFAGLISFALTALARVPAFPLLGVSIALATALGAALSISTVNKLKQEYKVAVANGKADLNGVINSAMKGECKKYLFVCIASLVACVALSAFFAPYVMFVGLHALVAGLSSACGAYALTPVLWGSIKSEKK